MRIWLPVALSGLVAGQAAAADMDLTVEIPRLDVAEYHRPYVAIWIEDDSREAVANLAVWYDVALENGEGTKWLKDLRQWWRRSGRSLEMPVDGVSGATQPVGEHELTFAGAEPPLDQLPPGEYQLVVEASREVGGREMLRIPFTWPPEAPVDESVAGEHELGAVTLNLTP